MWEYESMEMGELILAGASISQDDAAAYKTAIGAARAAARVARNIWAVGGRLSS